MLEKSIHTKSGAAAVEYALIAGLISVVMLSSLLNFGIRIQDLLQAVMQTLPA
ncbi:MAG: Flp family type IVb pilin [Thermodesulfovibrionales bacterium]|jgi:Flp pilus assembly pilin Flp